MKRPGSLILVLGLALSSCSFAKSVATGYRTYMDDSKAFSIDVPLDWRMRRIESPGTNDFPTLRTIYVTPKEDADRVLPRVSDQGGLVGIADPIVIVGVADEQIQGINDIPLTQAFGAANVTVVSELNRTFGDAHGKETELRWPDPSGQKHGRIVLLAKPGLTLFLFAMVGDSKQDTFDGTITHIIDSLKPKAG